MKKAGLAGFSQSGFALANPPNLQRADTRCLQALWAFLDFELDGLPFVQGTETATFDSGEVGEHISGAGVRRNEAKSLFSVEPFDFASLNHDLTES